MRCTLFYVVSKNSFANNDIYDSFQQRHRCNELQIYVLCIRHVTLRIETFYEIELP